MLQIYQKLRSLCLLILAFGFSVMVYGQKTTVDGTIIDESDGITLIGVTVLEKGTMNGTITDIDGRYSISVNEGATLIFTYIGYEEQEILVSGTRINVSMNYKSEILNEIVVIGYGEVKKGDATGAVATIGEKDFNQGVITSPQELLTGKIAGVQVTTDGAPGGGSTIRIRGSASMSANNDPLVVIDGIPVDNDGISGLGNPLSTINPDDIASMTVLKDASATAIYGSRASNGVIQVTTKRGTKGAPFVLTYNGKATVNTIPAYIESLDANQFRSQIKSYFGEESTQAALLGTANTDWQKEIMSNSFSQDHTVSVKGSTENIPYYVSLGYMDQNGIVNTSNYKRTTAAVSLSPTLFDDYLKLNFNIKTMFTETRFADNGAIGNAVTFDPTQPVRDEGNAYGGYWEWLQDNGNPITIAPANPVGMLEQREDRSEVSRYLGNFMADYKFHFLPELRANLNMAFDVSGSRGRIDVPMNARSSWDIDGDGNLIGGTMNHYSQAKRNNTLDFYLNYTKTIESIKSKFDVTAGYSWQHFYRNDYRYNSNISQTDIVDGPIRPTESYLISFFGRLNYTLNEKYLLTATVRNDNSSRFSKDTRAGIFPSVALAWKINEESFLKDVNAISQLKLRGGWGVTGQQDIGTSNYPYLPLYMWSEMTAMYQFGNQFVYTLRPSGYDPDIKWEETTTLNVGLDFGFARDRIFGSLEYYEKTTDDMINFIPVPAGSNLSNYILTNIGSMENKGYEVTLTGRIISTQNTYWELGVNMNYNENKITKLTLNDDPDYIGVPTGGISGGVGNNIQIHTVGYPMNSFYVYEQVYDEAGKPIQGLYVDRNGDGTITDDDKYRVHKPTADYSFGINSRFTYKQLELSFAGHGNIGNYVYNNVRSSTGAVGQMYNNTQYLINVTQDALETNFSNYEYFSDYYLEDASFFRMDYIRLGYTFSKLFSEKSDLNVSFTVQNAFVLTKYSGLDPEVFGGVDNNVYPRSRNFVLGLKLNI
ncbi:MULTISPECIES: TonB-dependent receptor [unclassified Lentimicrobium]|uniref:SusC/RagA family TonB-linked outer membrane protein n=1 Tax=unclassified Lentimicrobium TaxID=2677434 RepID=UPI001554426B|nr:MULTISPECIES: TonB-dependent receptor [unclassified Lentimicrobium]NPD46770.1 TonB-dependent receptor [Lentimicrobium sp. S6]NPD85673.1 TonB-dependent receptor [Lentimicrobium sp. L6]